MPETSRSSHAQKGVHLFPAYYTGRTRTATAQKTGLIYTRPTSVMIATPNLDMKLWLKVVICDLFEVVYYDLTYETGWAQVLQNFRPITLFFRYWFCTEKWQVQWIWGIDIILHIRHFLLEICTDLHIQCTTVFQNAASDRVSRCHSWHMHCTSAFLTGKFIHSQSTQCTAGQNSTSDRISRHHSLHICNFDREIHTWPKHTVHKW